MSVEEVCFHAIKLSWGAGVTEGAVGFVPDRSRTWFHPGPSSLIVTGDTTLVEIKPLLEQAFGSWRAGEPPQKNIAEQQTASRDRVLLIDKPGAEQSPFPEVHDHTQYRSVLSKHDSEAHQFEWSGRNGLVSKVDRARDLPSGDS